MPLSCLGKVQVCDRCGVLIFKLVLVSHLHMGCNNIAQEAILMVIRSRVSTLLPMCFV